MVSGGTKKASPAFSRVFGFPAPSSSGVPSRRYPNSSPGWVCLPTAAPGSNSARACTTSRPGTPRSCFCSSTRLNPGCCALSAPVAQTPASAKIPPATTIVSLRRVMIVPPCKGRAVRCYPRSIEVVLIRANSGMMAPSPSHGGLHEAPRFPPLPPHPNEVRRLRTRRRRAREARARIGRRAADQRKRVERGVLGEEGRRFALSLPQARRPARERRACQARRLPRPRIVHLVPPDLRPRRSGEGRVLADERLRRIRLRRLDDGPRELRPLGAQRGQLGHPQRRRGPPGRKRAGRARDGAEEDALHWRVLRRLARGGVRG